MRTKFILGLAQALAWMAFSGSSFGADAPKKPGQRDRDVERGEYLVMIAGCHDCHTPDFMAKGHKSPAEVLLTGSGVGWRGPWGTTYAANLRLLFQRMTEAEWIYLAKSIDRRPPMPFYSLNAMSEGDARAIYRYIRHLGPAGAPAPAFLPPDKTPPQPYVQFPGTFK